MIQEEMSRIMRAEKEQVNAEVEEGNKKVRDRFFLIKFFNTY
jgi:hypothetical protein